MTKTYHPKRLAHVAWHQAPRIKVIAIEHLADGWAHLTLACGHTARGASHFHYKVGETRSCVKCGEALALTLPEFVGATASED